MDSGTIKDDITDCLSQQISEYELLQSMYPENGEIVLTERSVITEIKKFLEGITEYIPSHLDYKINLHNISGLKVEVFINLPTSYPKEEPDLYVRCNKLNRPNESHLNSELSTYIKENQLGDVCIYTAISWLQENFDRFTIVDEKISTTEQSVQITHDKPARLWIYSHHIYNKKKREEIVKKARELKLTGFSLPGKPGIVCIEGSLDDCEEWWKDIKSMTWKKIGIRKTEEFEKDIQDYKKFRQFEELSLTMSELSKYMNQLGLGLVFNEIFGLGNDDCDADNTKDLKNAS